MKSTRSAGGIVINMKSGKILMVNQEGQRWSFPKGHIDKGENEFEAAKREIYEESGIRDLELIKNIGSYERIGSLGNEFKSIHMFLFKTKEEELGPIDYKNPEARWVEKDKVADLLTHPKDKEFFIRVKDGI